MEIVKKLFMVTLTLSLCVALSACMGSVVDDAASRDISEVFQVDDYPILITTPKGWEKEADMESFDLQCRSPKEDMYLSVYGYNAIDFAADQTTQELFELQTNEILSLRDNVTEIEPITSTEDDEKILYLSYYSGEHEAAKFYYRFFFIRFKSTDDMVWILFNGMPSVVERNKEAIDDMIAGVQNTEPK